MRIRLQTRLHLTLLAASLAAGLLPAQPTIAPGANLVVEGLPPIPANLAAEVRRYTESRGAGLAAWHPQRLEMIVSTRFGNTAQLHAVAMPLGMRRQLTFFEEPVSDASYEPRRGDYFVFGRDTGGNEFGQLYRYDVADGAITLLTDGGRSQNGGPIWSNAGDRIAYASTRRNGADRDVYLMDPLQSASDRLLAPLAGGGWFAVDWSMDDRKLLLFEYVSVNESHLWLLDTATGAKEELTPRSESGVAYGGAGFSRDGKGVYLTTDRDFEFQRLAYLDLATRRLTYLTTALPHDVENFDLSDDGRWVAFTTNESGLNRVYLLDTASGAYRAVAGLPVANVGGLQWHNDSRHVAMTITSPRSTGDVWVLDAADGRVTRWTESELGGLVAANLSEAELVRWRSFDGLEITGFLYRPPAKFTGPRPVIINVHGGPEGQAQPQFLGRSNYYLNELGVAIIFPNIRGSTGFGKTFVTLDNGPKREDSVRDIGALLNWIAAQPTLDASRVMVTGGSYGGYVTLASAIHYGDRVRCFVDVVGISSFVTFLQNTESYRRDLRRAEYGDERDPAMRAVFDRIDPLHNARKITRPLFIVQGANDPRVPRTEARQIFDQVKANGGPVWYLEAKDEGHGFRKKANSDFQFYATVMFVREHLLK